jgi:hypothetical protein
MIALQESLYTPRWGSSLVRLCTLSLHTTHAPPAHLWAHLAVYLMIVLFLLFIRFLPCALGLILLYWRWGLTRDAASPSDA